MRVALLTIFLGTFLAAASQAESPYDRVMRSGKIRAAYMVYPPSCIKDPNTGKLSGIWTEAVEKAAENLQLKVEWAEEVMSATIIEGLLSNRYDILGTGIWPNSTRTRTIDFSCGLYYSGVGVYARANEQRWKQGGLEVLNDPSVRIATIYGSTIDHIARTLFPKATRVSLPEMSSFSELLMHVSTLKADVTFVENFVAHQFSERNPGKIQNLRPDRPVKVFPTCIALKRGEFEFRNMLNRALEELVNSGFVDHLLRKYSPAPHSVYPLLTPYRLKP
jgi:ABC-type amino acid transport substrate-binding protein